jgi:hypothetical protein
MPKNVVIIPASGWTYFNNSSSQTVGQLIVDPITEEFVISGTSLNLESSTLINVGSGSGDVYIGDGLTSTNIIFEQNGSIKGNSSPLQLTLGSTTDYVKISTNGQFDLLGIVSASTPSNTLSYNPSTGRVTYSTISSSFTGGTVSGATRFTGGLSANTISATTITSIGGNIVTKISSGVDSSGNTTAGAFTVLSSVIILANTFTTGDVVSFKVRMRKSGTNGTVNYRISANTTLNLTGSQTIGVFNAGATIVYGELGRTLIIKGATSEVFNTSITNVQSDVTTSISSVSSVSVDWTVDQYIMFNINQSSALDTTNISYYSINKI